MQQGWNSQIWCMKEGSKSIYCMIWLTWNSPVSKTNLEWLDEFRIVVMDAASIYWGLPCSSGGKESACNSGDPSVISGSGRSLEKGWLPTPVFLGFPCGSDVKNLPAMRETWVQSLGLGRYPGVGHGNPLQCSCLEKLHGQRSLAGYSPQGHKESDMTERLSTVYTEKRCEGAFWALLYVDLCGISMGSIHL